MSAQILFILMTNPSHRGFEMLGINAIRLPLLQLGFAVQGMSLLPSHSDSPIDLLHNCCAQVPLCVDL